MFVKEKAHLAAADPILGGVIDAIPTPEIWTTNNVFHDLMSCILEQQIHYRSTKKTFQKMLQKADLTTLTPDNFETFEEKAFEGVSLSMKKYETVSNILEYWVSNDLQWATLSDEEVREKLSTIKGVGKWTIDMILLFTLQRPNIFSYDDFHIKQIMTGLYGLNPQSKLKAQMTGVAQVWQPYQSTAFRYLLGWKSFNKNTKK